MNSPYKGMIKEEIIKINPNWKFCGFKKGHKINKGKSHPPWNKNLTNENDIRIKISSEKKSKTLKEQYKSGKRVSARGFLNKKHTDEWKKEASRRVSGNLNPSKRPEVREKMKEARKQQIVPKKDTSIEIKIQNFLKELNIKFEVHKYINIEHGYQCDVYIPSSNLIIECDGNYWHNYPEGTEIDKIRTTELLVAGYEVLRLWESDIRKMNIEDFKKILRGRP